jgi:hypothetical protein
MRAWPPIRRFAVERLTVVVLALALAALAVVPGNTTASPCRAPMAAGDAALDRTVVDRVGVRAGERDDPRPSTGIDLEVRVFNLRVEFPWMRALPVSPARHIVISLLARNAGDPPPSP